MIKEISNDMFVKEMQILWQNGPLKDRSNLGRMIRDYFDSMGSEKRADRIVNKLCEKIEN